jgi:fibronectin-binding autotransporter adhesin
MTLKITSDNIATSTLDSLGGGVKITTVAYPGSVTAADIAGSQTITVTGSGFNSGIIAYINTTSCSTTYGNSTSLTFTTPATSAGTYNIILYNTDGTNGTKPAGIIFNQPPVWVTASGALTAGINNTAYSQSVSASGTGIVYSVTSGALPDGLSLNSSSGAITGTPTVANTFNFTITATNNYNQPTARAFSILIANIVLATALVVAGGGSGGTGYYGGGGGAGGVLESNVNLSLGVTYTITIGTGGVGTTTQTNRGGTGANSSISGSGFTTITAIGGGGGGSRNNDQNTAGAQGGPGGSGGGASYVANAGGKGVYPGSTYLDQARQGYDGGATNNDNTYSAGGGGAGAAGAGINGTPNPRAGGVGLVSTITGSSVYYGGGGGNAFGTSYAGLGGGGTANTAGTANTGGGGGGGSGNNTQGGNGGSGVVIIKYPDTYAAATTTGSPTVTSITGFRIYKFTGTGTFTIN